VKGTNHWDGSGNVSTEVEYGETGSGEPACNFRIAVERSNKQLLFLRINVYGDLVSLCKVKDLRTGDYVVISGELMGRERRLGGRRVTLIECRCLELIINPGNRAVRS
jgi:single-stranded DNA-binding protein